MFWFVPSAKEVELKKDDRRLTYKDDMRVRSARTPAVYAPELFGATIHHDSSTISIHEKTLNTANPASPTWLIPSAPRTIEQHRALHEQT
jgi:hypothetical protein